MIRSIKQKEFNCICSKMASIVRSVNLNIHWRGSITAYKIEAVNHTKLSIVEVVACTSRALNANMSFVTVAVNLFSWAPSAVCQNIVRNWVCIHIIREIVCSIYETRNREIFRDCSE